MSEDTHLAVWSLRFLLNANHPKKFLALIENGVIWSKAQRCYDRTSTHYPTETSSSCRTAEYLEFGARVEKASSEMESPVAARFFTKYGVCRCHI